MFSQLHQLQEQFAAELNKSRFFPLLADVREYQAGEDYALSRSAKGIRELEKSLVARLPQYATSTSIRQVSLEEIIAKLPEGYVLVDYVQYNPFETAAGQSERDKAADFMANLKDYFIFGTDKKTAAADLAANRGRYQKMLAGLGTDLKELEAKLGLDDPALTVSKLEPVTGRYAAFIVKRDPPRLQVVDVGEAGYVDNLVTSVRAEIDEWGKAWLRFKQQKDPDGQALGTYYTPAAKALSQTLLTSILSAIGGYQKVLISADGTLFEFPFEILPLPGNRYLIEDYDIQYVDAVRNLIHFDDPPAEQSPSLVVADPDFDLSAPVPATHADASVSSGQSEAADRVATRMHSYFDPEWPGFPRLKGAREEGQYVVQCLEPGTVLWLGDQALKGKLLAVKSPRILHIATHGFVFSTINPQGGSRGGPWFGQFNDPEQDYAEIHDNPLLRCGLLLAGANAYLRGNPAADQAGDGFLTGVDICCMDLSSTELVISSACCTGLGEIRPGEGTFGLRRAFVLAGARSLLVSLWSVPDQETRELLSRFYDGLSRRLSKPAALKEVKLP